MVLDFVLHWLHAILKLVWLPSSSVDDAKKCQAELMKKFANDVRWEEYYVLLEEFGTSIYTQKISSKNKQGKGIMIALHGFGGGSGVWTKSLNQLATQCETLYVLDMIGFARSTICTTVSDNIEPEAWFVDSLEAWRKKMQIEKMTILGHSFGGFISSLYTLKYPKHVEKLVLVSPIGIAPAFDRLRSKSVAVEKLWIKAGEMFYNLRITLNQILRATGPFSKYLVRVHAMWRFHNGVPLAEYTWRTNTLAPTLASQKTEKGIWQLLLPGAFAKKSLVERMENYSESEIHRFCHITKFIYGDNDWMDSTEPNRLKKRVLSIFNGIQLDKECMLVQFVEQSGHQVPWDNPKRFTEIIDL